MISELTPAQRTAIAQWLNLRALQTMQRMVEEEANGRQQHAAILQAEASALAAAASDLRRMDEGGQRNEDMTAVSIEDVGDDYVASLKARLARHGITAAELARAAGMNKSQISRYFTSKKGMQPSLANVRRLEAALQDLVQAQTQRQRKGGSRHK